MFVFTQARLSGTGSDFMSLKGNVLTRTYGSATSAANTSATETTSTFPADLLASVTKAAMGVTQPGLEETSPSKTIWDRINSPSNQRSLRIAGLPAASAAGTILQPTVVIYSSIAVFCSSHRCKYFFRSLSEL